MKTFSVTVLDADACEAFTYLVEAEVDQEAVERVLRFGQSRGFAYAGFCSVQELPTA